MRVEHGNSSRACRMQRRERKVTHKNTRPPPAPNALHYRLPFTGAHRAAGDVTVHLRHESVLADGASARNAPGERRKMLTWATTRNFWAARTVRQLAGSVNINRGGVGWFNLTRMAFMVLTFSCSKNTRGKVIYSSSQDQCLYYLQHLVSNPDICANYMLELYITGLWVSDVTCCNIPAQINSLGIYHQGN